ncbi:MAG: OmpA family protein [Pseudomonadota bacterium]
MTALPSQLERNPFADTLIRSLQLFALALTSSVVLAGCAGEERQPPTVATAQPTWTREEGNIAPATVSTTTRTIKSTPAPPPYAVSLAATAKAEAKRHIATLAASDIAVLHPNEVGYYVDTLDARLIQVLQKDGLKVARNGDTLTLALEGGDLFASGGARLSETAKERLQHICAVLAEYDRTRVIVAGHTDDVGEAAFNETLSVRRASAIADLLVKAGVAPARLFIVGYGESDPVANNNSEQGRARNRRVVLTIEPLQRIEPDGDSAGKPAA